MTRWEIPATLVVDTEGTDPFEAQAQAQCLASALVHHSGGPGVFFPGTAVALTGEPEQISDGKGTLKNHVERLGKERS